MLNRFKEEVERAADFMQGTLVTNSIKQAWKSFTAHILLLIATHLFSGLWGVLINNYIENLSRHGRYYYYSNSPLVSILGLVATLGSLWLTVGVFKINLAIVDGKPVTFSDLFTGSDRFWSFVGVTILSGIVTGLGTFFFVLPGIILGVYLISAGLVTVDQRLGVLASIGESFRLVRGSFWSTVGFMILLAIINYIGVMFFGIGVVITAPFSSLALTYLYRNLLYKQGRS